MTSIARVDAEGRLLLPALIRGRLVWPGDRGQASGYTLERGLRDPSTLKPTGRRLRLLLPGFDPDDLVEDDPAVLAKGLYALPFSEVLAYVDGLRTLLRREEARIVEFVAQVGGAESGPFAELVRQLPLLLDPDGLARAIDDGLGVPGVPGRAFLDSWVEVPQPTFQGSAATHAASFLPKSVARTPLGAAVRAVPTRQLHITAGNSPVVPILSWLRALSTKGAVVVKSPSSAVAVIALLAWAMHELDGDHPITRHTSMVYWPGGDRSVEDTLFRRGAFDRIVVWGSPGTVESVRARAGSTRTVVLDPRYGVSLIGVGALDDVAAAAARASVDTMISDQHACTASLVHFVEGTEDQAIAYAEALAAVMASWDAARPPHVSAATLGRIRLLRRGPLIRGRWFVNKTGGQPSSAVVYSSAPFDVAEHPMARFVVVRRVDRLEDAVGRLDTSVSAVGVAPQAALERVRDGLAARGVTTVLPLGLCETSFAGMPHDGMRILSDLVNWSVSANPQSPRSP